MAPLSLASPGIWALEKLDCLIDWRCYLSKHQHIYSIKKDTRHLMVWRFHSCLYAVHWQVSFHCSTNSTLICSSHQNRARFLLDDVVYVFSWPILLTTGIKKYAWKHVRLSLLAYLFLSLFVKAAYYIVENCQQLPLFRSKYFREIFWGKHICLVFFFIKGAAPNSSKNCKITIIHFFPFLLFLSPALEPPWNLWTILLSKCGLTFCHILG